MQRRAILSTLALAPMLGHLSKVGAAESADAYPSRQIRFIVPFAPGGQFDGLARLFAEKLSASWKQTVIVENKTGGATMIGAAQVAKSPGDGYTLLFGASGVAQNPALYPKMGYEPSELTPVARLHDIPFSLAVHTSLGVNTLSEFIAKAKTANGKMTYGQISTTSQALGEIFKQSAGIQLIGVPYKGEALALNDLLGNQIDATFISPGTAANYPDKLKVLAVTGTKRVARLPNVPTFEEAGISTLKQSGWGGIFLPSTTPRDIVNKLSAEFARIGVLPEVVQRTNNAGYPVSVAEAAEFERFVNAEYGYWRDIFTRYNIKAE